MNSGPALLDLFCDSNESVFSGRLRMEVIKISPRGYCYGVVDALTMARKAAKDPTLPRPIYIIGQIIHNRHAIDELTSMGIITLDGPNRAVILEEVKEGTVIFTAHGVSPEV